MPELGDCEGQCWHGVTGQSYTQKIHAFSLQTLRSSQRLCVKVREWGASFPSRVAKAPSNWNCLGVKRGSRNIERCTVPCPAWRGYAQC